MGKSILSNRLRDMQSVLIDTGVSKGQERSILVNMLNIIDAEKAEKCWLIEYLVEQFDLSIEEIVKDAGISRATVYRHFMTMHSRGANIVYRPKESTRRGGHSHAKRFGDTDVLRQHKNYATTFCRAKRANLIPPWYSELDEFVINEAFHLCDLRKVATGIRWSLDHCIPMNAKFVRGFHSHNNVQVIPLAMNVEKKNQILFTEQNEWLQYL